MMAIHLLEEFHHAWRERMSFSSQWVWKRREFQGTSSKPKTTAALSREQKPEPHIQNLRVTTGNKLQTTCSLNQTEQTWVKRCRFKVTCDQCVFTGCPRMLQNETLQKKGQMEKTVPWSTLKMHWIFQGNKEGTTWEEQKYPKGVSKRRSGDQYRPGFKAANMIRRVGANPWLERTWSTKHSALGEKNKKYFLKARLFLCFLERKKLKPLQDFAPGGSGLLTAGEQHSTHQNSLSWTTFCNLLLI